MARLVILITCLSMLVAAEAQPTLIFSCMTSKSTCHKFNDRWVGWYIDIVGPLLEQHSEFKFDYNPLPAKRLYKSLHSGDLQITILPKNTELNPNLIYSKRPVGYSQIALYSLSKINQFQGLAHLPLPRIALHRGMTYNGIREELDALSDKVHLLLVNNNDNIYRLLEKKRVDYVLSYRLPGVTPEASRHPHTVLQKIDMHFALSAKHPAARSTMKKLDQAIDRVYSKLNLTFYFPPQDEYVRRELAEQE